MTVPDDNYSYFPSDLFDSGWGRWMPANALYLYCIVGTATVHELDGTLDDLIATLPPGAHYPEGTSTPLHWHDNDEDDEPENEDEDENNTDNGKDHVTLFNNAVAHLAPPPTTIGDYAHILTQLGIFTHTHTTTTEQWRSVTPMPLPTEVLHLPPDVAADEDRIRWELTVDKTYVQNILHTLYTDTPSHIDTSIERFARRCELAPESCRHGLTALAESGEITTSRHGTTADLEHLPDHARLVIKPQWDTLADNRFTIRPLNNSDGTP